MIKVETFDENGGTRVHTEIAAQDTFDALTEIVLVTKSLLNNVTTDKLLILATLETIMQTL